MQDEILPRNGFFERVVEEVGLALRALAAKLQPLADVPARTARPELRCISGPGAALREETTLTYI